MIISLLKSFRKSRRLKRISKELSQPLNWKSMPDLLTGINRDTKEKAFDELYELGLNDEVVRHVLESRKVDKETLRKIYHLLILNGAGQYVAGHYAAASSLVYGFPLLFLLHHFDGERFNILDLPDFEANQYIAFRVTEYFRKGEVGMVTY